MLGARFFSHSLRSWKKSAGFTLTELVVVMALTVIIALVAFLNLSNYRRVQNLKLTIEELITVIRDVKKRSITQENGLPWGVKFVNNAGSEYKYEVFWGDIDSQEIEKSYVLRGGVKFSNPSGSELWYDAAFSAINGTLPENKIISLISSARDNIVGDLVLNTLGLVVSRLEIGSFGFWELDDIEKT